MNLAYNLYLNKIHTSSHIQFCKPAPVVYWENKQPARHQGVLSWYRDCDELSQTLYQASQKD